VADSQVVPSDCQVSQLIEHDAVDVGVLGRFRRHHDVPDELSHALVAHARGRFGKLG
jgi:hypothetical protein